jgi:hypothetical protein
MINLQKLHKELETAGLPVCSVHADGQIDYTAQLTAEQTLTAQYIIAAHNPQETPEPTPQERLEAIEDSLDFIIRKVYNLE